MEETITQHKFNSFELELIGYLTSIINEISQVEFNLCLIYNSLIDLSIKKKNNDLNLTTPSWRPDILQPIDTPFIPELRHSPKRTQLVIIGTLMGIVFSIMFVIIRYYLLKSFDQH